MSTIIVELPGIQGDTSYTIDKTTYANHIGCSGMMHSVDLPLAVTSSARTEGASVHGPIGLIHSFDKATPLLRQTASKGEMIAVAKIYRLRMSGTTASIAELITLNSVYIVRVDVDTYLSDTNTPTDNIMETFWLEYGSISWDYKYKAPGATAATSVVMSWSPSTLSDS